MLVVAALLVLSIGLVQGQFTFNLPTSIPQCSRFTVNWSNAQAANLPFQPFNVSVLPFDAVPFLLNVPATAWTSNTAGSFEATVPIMTGSSFILSTGVGTTGATSTIITIAPSTDSTCLRQGPPPSTFSFATAPINCNPAFLNISFFSADGSIPNVRGYVPRGTGPFPVAAVRQDGQTFFSVTTPGETQIALEFQGPNDLSGVSRLITVGGSQAISGCLQNLLFTPRNATINSAAQTDSPVVRNQSGRIIGIVVGTVLGTFAIGWGVFLIRERYRSRDKNGRRKIRDSEFGMVVGGASAPEKMPIPDAFSEKQRERESKLFPYNSSAFSNAAPPPPLPPPVLSQSPTKPKRTALARFLVRKSMIGRPTNVPPDVFETQRNRQAEASSNIGSGPDPRDIGRVV